MMAHSLGLHLVHFSFRLDLYYYKSGCLLSTIVEVAVCWRKWKIKWLLLRKMERQNV
ncbi:unnamed protein product [Meloidogyne enterolobii]|uniref:Uncharacterized protein n=1 Tax=Meloidogyne enterolobii TaxID=390850 RepID=A0ACB0YTG2_MELEN